MTNTAGLVRTLTVMAASLLLVQVWTAVSAETIRAASNDGVEVYIISPLDGAKVATTFTVQFGLKGMGVVPAGIDFAGAGHHHLLVDLKSIPDMNMPLPANDNIIHFGKGQTQVDLNLKPGEHTLQLILGDYRHIPHDNPVVSKKITVTVIAP